MVPVLGVRGWVMSASQLVVTKVRNREHGTILLKSVDEDLASKLPDLRLPIMPDEARAAFRAILAYEAPPANGSLVDLLQFAEVRGYAAHPCDWIPDYDWKYAGGHPRLYQPWVDWLSEEGLTKFHQGNTLTPENFQRFSPGQRGGPIKALIRKGRSDDFAEVKAVAEAQPASARALIVNSISAWGSFDGCYPWQVPLLEYFAADKSDKVRSIARASLEKMGSLLTEEDYARKLANHITIRPDGVGYAVAPTPHTFPFFKEFTCVSFAALANALGLTPTELASRSDLDGLGKELMGVAAVSGDPESRTILANRYLDKGTGGESLSLMLFEGLAKPIRARGLQAMFQSPYMDSVQEYLGAETGTLDAPSMRNWSAYQQLGEIVTDELKKKRQLPVNIIYDPLRCLGKVVNKEVARQVLDEAIGHGMSPDNPRLTMLKFNLAL